MNLHNLGAHVDSLATLASVIRLSKNLNQFDDPDDLTTALVVYHPYVTTCSCSPVVSSGSVAKFDTATADAKKIK